MRSEVQSSKFGEQSERLGPCLIRMKASLMSRFNSLLGHNISLFRYVGNLTVRL